MGASKEPSRPSRPARRRGDKSGPLSDADGGAQPWDGQLEAEQERILRESAEEGGPARRWSRRRGMPAMPWLPSRESDS